MSQPPRTHFNINPHSTEYFDVLLVPYVLNARIMDQLNTLAPHMHIWFADPVTPWVPAQTCTLRLVAEGGNTAPVEGMLHFRRAGSSASRAELGRRVNRQTAPGPKAKIGRRAGIAARSR
jgi:hypothetical protein